MRLWVLQLDHHWSFEKRRDNFRLVLAKDRRAAELLTDKFYRDVHGIDYSENRGIGGTFLHYAALKVYSIPQFIGYLWYKWIRRGNYGN